MVIKVVGRDGRKEGTKTGRAEGRKEGRKVCVYQQNCIWVEIKNQKPDCFSSYPLRTSNPGEGRREWKV